MSCFCLTDDGGQHGYRSRKHPLGEKKLRIFLLVSVFSMWQETKYPAGSEWEGQWLKDCGERVK